MIGDADRMVPAPGNLILPAGFSLVAFNTIGSTNDEARRQALGGAAHGTTIWAREQSAGRGRQDRRWISPRGNLFVSFVLRPHKPPTEISQLGFVAALAVAEVVRRFCPAASVTLKWPNDVLIAEIGIPGSPLLQPPPARGGGFMADHSYSPPPLQGGGREEGGLAKDPAASGAKVAGILLESSISYLDTVDWLILGIGINLVTAPAATPYKAAALAEFAAAPSPEQALSALAPALDRWLRIWEAEGFSPVRQAWLENGTVRGSRIAVKEGSVVSEGIFLDLDQDGALVFEAATGIRRITAADVYFPTA